MKNLLANQEQTGQAMEQLMVSFKKTARDRRTVEYVRRKLETLEMYWKDYQNNHSRLCEFGKTDEPYFQDNNFQQGLEFYEGAKEQLMQYLQRPESPQIGQEEGKAITTPSTSKKETWSLPELPEKRSQATDSKTAEMLKKQASNFKAFSWTVNNIDLEAVTEKWEFEDLLKEIQGRWAVIDSLHWQLDSEIGGENVEYESTFVAHEKTYQFMKKAINSKLWSNAHREKSTPKMEIPSFNGNYYNWVSFRDLFMETIHLNPLLSNAQKMQFLKSKVNGEAEKLIQHLQISSDNYQTCWDILNHRYHNKRLIFTSHINRILNLAVIQQPNAKQIKRLHDTTNECLNAIRNLGVDIKTWDPLLVHLISQKLDSDTHSDYMESLKQPRDLQTLKDFLDFLENKFTSMESSAARRKPENQSKSNAEASGASGGNRQQKSQSFKSFATNKSSSDSGKQQKRSSRAHTPSKNCAICGDEQHRIYLCQQFLSMPADVKRNTISKHNLCKNCLHDHKGKSCYSTKRCRECNDQHNTILHEAFANDVVSTTAESKQEPKQTSSTYVSQRNNQQEMAEILITTAMVHVQAGNSAYKEMRALVDQCSQITLITEKAAQRLKLPRKRCKSVVAGVGEKENNCKGIVTLTCASLYNPKFIFTVEAYIMNKLVKDLPSSTFKKQHWPHLEGLQLADSNFNISRSVDIILGSDIYPELILDGLRKGNSPTMPVAQHTALGWIICGSTESTTSPTRQCYVVNYFNEMRRFWEVEDVTEDVSKSAEDQKCIEHFEKTTVRREDGRYEIRLPFKPDYKDQLGSSTSAALAQFRQLERKFSKNNVIEQEYKQFINEYIQLHHMKLSMDNLTPGYYLPHHAIIRAESTTTKLRVVFNASARSSTGYSLNDVMYTGPNLQKDLLTIILNWRQFQFAYTADIEKMYRQIMVHEDDQAYQKIWWRDAANQPIQTYQLSTLTYGTKPAPFLAMMCLKQLAADERQKFPDAARALEQCFYMDDYCGGDHSLEGAIQLRNDLILLLKSGGFNLRKWTSSEPALLTDLSPDQCNPKMFEFKHPESTKTLGLGWNPQGDKFIFKSTLPPSPLKSNTKRSLLSDISKLFDPLGWLTPLSTSMKILFQTVWLSNLQWDDKLPAEIQKKWATYRQELQDIDSFEIRRWLGIEKNDHIELHGFCDASQKAYSGVIYCRIRRNTNSVISLVASKARVAPVNKVLSIPRLELLGAELLSKLMSKVQQCFSSYPTEVYGWSDSTAVLGWLQGDPARWKPFIANRVAKIRNVMPSVCWNYVKTTENPADCASRGLSVAQLKEHNLWWEGPSWLTSFRKLEETIYVTSLEIKPSIKQTNAIIKSKAEPEVMMNIIDHLMNKHSSINKIVRIFAWILRIPSYKKQVHQPHLTLQELRHAKMLIIRSTQSKHFADDIISLRNFTSLPSKSVLLNLNPVIDGQGLLRVGGRLQKANINCEMKHPIIIPHDSRLTNLLLQEAHELTFHGGARLTLSNLRQKYWVIGGNRATKKFIHRCVTCRKQNPQLQCQLMGDLPSARINPEKAFYHTGVDYTGYVDVKANKGRGIKTTKGYIAVFVCMVTKAVHLELVSDLSSTAFLAALSRMAARRGTPRHIYSDNGTNFVGANRLLQEQYNHLQQMFNNNFLTEISDMGINWHFNAPSWPNAGGLWERAVRSLKHHLKRVVGEQKLTYEEYATLLSQVEGCLNSRPLCALTEDPDDIEFLTPSHFLTAKPGSTLIETASDARTRWHLIAKLFEDLWKRWKTEYLTQLSVRSKWLKSRENIRLGDLVTIHEDNLPAGKWSMGRVIDLHPGHDGCVRVVSLKTKNGIIKRPVIKLSVLPVYPDRDHDSSINNNHAATDGMQKNNRQPRSLMSMAIALMLFLSLLTNTHAAYNVTSLPGNMSVYFDAISNLQVIRDKWTLVVYYDMAPYWEGTTAVMKSLNHSDKICTRLLDKVQCTTILLQLRHEYQELQHYNKLLLHQQFDAHARHRRGLINGIGYVANSLFGVLDEQFAEQYRKDIELIRQNEHHLTSMLRNQTSVVEAEYNLLKRTENIMSIQHKTINKHLNALDETINHVQEKMFSIREVQDFTLSAMTTSNLIQNLKRIQDTLLDTVTDIYHGKFNTHLLTPDQLRNELQVISSQLTKDIKLPIENIQTDLRYIYNLLKIKGRVLRDYFIFEITFPLTSRETYNLYKTIPIPHQIANNKMIKVYPINEYIAVNLGKDSYLSLSATELQACLYNEYSYLCHITTPIRYLSVNENFCKLKASKDQCTVNVSTCNHVWQELNELSKYFYFCCNTYALRIICNDHVTSEQLSGAGVIHLGSNCIIKGEDFALYARLRSVHTLALNPEIVTPNIADLNPMVNISLSKYIEPRDDQINQTLEELGNQIKHLKSTVNDPSYDVLSTHDIHQYVITYVLMGAMVLAAAVFLWRRRRASARVSCAETAVQSVVFSRRQHTADRQLSEVSVDSTVQSEVVSRRLNTADRQLSEVPVESIRANSVKLKDQASSPIPRKCIFQKDIHGIHSPFSPGGCSESTHIPN